MGHRLPSVMGPPATDTGAMASAGAIFGAPAMWMAAFIGGLFEAVVGASDVLAALRRFLPPYVCGLVVTTIGVSLARVAGGWVFSDTRPAMLGLSAGVAVCILFLTVLGNTLRLGVLARRAWFDGLSPFSRLLLSNPVVIATLLGIGLEALLGGLLRRRPA